MSFYSPWQSRVVLTFWRKRLVGKTALVGITDNNPDGTLNGYRQLVGTIQEVRPGKGVLLKLQNGEEYWLPPDHRPIKRAPKGEYRLRSTGQIVADPDYLMTWVRTMPSNT
jgi:hypothetical protein